MISSLAASINFILSGNMLLYYAGTFGALTIVSAYVGIISVNAYIRRSGKQSMIALILVLCLVIALVSMPLNYVDFGKH